MEVKAVHPDRLAVDGGVPVRAEPLPRWPHFDAGDSKPWPRFCARARSTTGPETNAGSSRRNSPATAARRYGVALANGTVALELALRNPGHRRRRRGHRDPAILHGFGRRRRAARRQGGFRRRRSRYPEHHRGNHRSFDHRHAPGPSSVSIWPGCPATWIPSWSWRRPTTCM